MTPADKFAEVVEEYLYGTASRLNVEVALTAYYRSRTTAPPVDIERLVRENAMLTAALRDACIDHDDECRCAHCELVFRSSAVLREAGVIDEGGAK